MIFTFFIPLQIGESPLAFGIWVVGAIIWAIIKAVYRSSKRKIYRYGPGSRPAQLYHELSKKDISYIMRQDVWLRACEKENPVYVKGHYLSGTDMLSIFDYRRQFRESIECRAWRIDRKRRKREKRAQKSLKS